MSYTIEDAVEILEGYVANATDTQIHIMVAIMCGIDYENQNLDTDTYIDMLLGTIKSMCFAQMCVTIDVLERHYEFQKPKL